MVRVVTVSSIGPDETGRYFSDREVDGVEYLDAREYGEVQVKDPPLQVKTSVLKGGRKS